MKAIGTQTLITEDLILRRFELSDAPAMFSNWAGHPDNVTYLTWPAHADLDVTQATLERWVASYQDGDSFKWAITLKSQPDQVIGDISALDYVPATNSMTIGYVLGRDYWGKGYMTQALIAVSRFLLQEADLNRLSTTHDTANPGSGRVMQKAGFHFEGILRQAGHNNQGIVDIAHYSLLKSDLYADKKSHYIIYDIMGFLIYPVYP